MCKFQIGLPLLVCLFVDLWLDLLSRGWSKSMLPFLSGKSHHSTASPHKNLCRAQHRLNCVVRGSLAMSYCFRRNRAREFLSIELTHTR
eukprot:jgi/Botrbrau1/23602/Bobra.0141s0064.1